MDPFILSRQNDPRTPYQVSVALAYWLFWTIFCHHSLDLLSQSVMSSYKAWPLLAVSTCMHWVVLLQKFLSHASLIVIPLPENHSLFIWDEYSKELPDPWLDLWRYWIVWVRVRILPAGFLQREIHSLPVVHKHLRALLHSHGSEERRRFLHLDISVILGIMQWLYFGVWASVGIGFLIIGWLLVTNQS